MNRMEGKTNTLELADPPSPESLMPGPPLSPWWVAGAVAAVLLLAALLGWLAKRRRSTVSAASVREAAFKEACAAFAEIQATDSREAAVRSSLILRHYLSKACGDPSLFETHEEFVARHDALAALCGDARGAARSGFESLSRMKYSAESPSVPASEVLSSSRALLQTLHRGFRS